MPFLIVKECSKVYNIDVKTNKILPQSVKAVLWSYDLNQIDLETHKKLLITQVLNFGNKEATDWLFKTYCKDEIIAVASQIPTGGWNKKSLALWSLYLGIETQTRAERIFHAR